jgi:hypothetical protein
MLPTLKYIKEIKICKENFQTPPPPSADPERFVGVLQHRTQIDVDRH